MSILFLFFLSQCVHGLKIDTEPTGASIYVLDNSGKRKNLLGKTPINLTTIPKSDEILLLETQKEGYISKGIVIPKIGEANISINLSLQEMSGDWVKNSLKTEFSVALNENMQMIFKLQKFITQKDDVQVLKLYEQMKESYERVSIFHSLMGNFYYLKNDKKTALTFYRKALQYDPSNEEAAQMIRSISK